MDRSTAIVFKKRPLTDVLVSNKFDDLATADYIAKTVQVSGIVYI